jgi:hypothetical protein
VQAWYFCIWNYLPDNAVRAIVQQQQQTLPVLKPFTFITATVAAAAAAAAAVGIEDVP